MSSRLLRFLVAAIVLLLVSSGLSSDTPQPGDEQDRARAYTRDLEFDYISWMLDAAAAKMQASAVGVPGYLDRESARIVVSDYLLVTARIVRAEDALNRIHADPGISDKESASTHIRALLLELGPRQADLAPVAEAVLQIQVAQVLSDLGLGAMGQPLPPVLFHTTAVPDALIVSPRDEIRQIANISIEAGLPIESQVSLEERVEAGLNASALVVPVGGIGVYPTMIMRTTDRNWLASTIAHEWAHNYLQFRPLGMLYDQTPELRTMNETTAEIVGTEIGNEVMRRNYALAAPGQVPDLILAGLPVDYPDPGDADPPPFDFRVEMHRTRVTVDAMLASGRINEAEKYMEQRRQLFVQNGYIIRRLNQAYFAFYGAYADTPGGPAGEDPVGPAVRALRSRSGSLSEFVERISWMTSFEQLQEAVGQ